MYEEVLKTDLPETGDQQERLEAKMEMLLDMYDVPKGGVSLDGGELGAIGPDRIADALTDDQEVTNQ